MDSKTIISISAIKNIIPWIISIIFLGSLVGYGIKGFQSRYVADDYCYGYRVNQNGFLYNQVNSYLTLTEYSSNRYSLTLFNNLAEKLGGAKFVPFVPSATIILWLFGLTYLFIQINELVNNKKSLSTSIASSATILLFTFYLAPNLYQILFWLSGIHPYNTPLILLIILLGRLLAVVRKNSPIGWTNYIEFGLISFIACGFSETTALWQLALFVAGLAIAFFFREKSVLAKKSIKPLWIIIAFTTLSLALIVINPTNSIRGSPFVKPDIVTLIYKSLFHGEEFIRISLKSIPLPLIVVFGLGYLLNNWLTPEHKTKNILTFLLFLNLVGILLIIATMVPSMYAMAAYPGDRALFPAHFTLILLTFANGWLAKSLMMNNSIANQLAPKQSLVYLIISIVLIGYVLSRVTPRVYEGLDKYQLRAQAWDRREQSIIAQKQTGQQDIIIPAFDSAYSIFEIQDKSFHWINMCVAKYYKVETIVARQNYQDVPTYPIDH